MSRLDADRVLVVGAAFADGTSDTLRQGTSLLVEGSTVTGLWFDGDGPEGDTGATVIDGSGATIVPGMVDSHAHLSMPGGARWTERGLDPTEDLLCVGEDNGELLVRAYS